MSNTNDIKMCIDNCIYVNIMVMVNDKCWGVANTIVINIEMFHLLSYAFDLSMIIFKHIIL